jgi:ABC-type Fe3+ transport system permease subunit
MSNIHSKYGMLARLIRQIRFSTDAVIWVQLAIPIAMFSMFLIIPLAAVVFSPLIPSESGYTYNPLLVFTDPSMVSFRSYRPAIITRPITLQNGEVVTRITIIGGNYGILINSLINAALVTAGAGVLGLIVAFTFARYSFPGKLFFRILAIVPLLMTPFINAFVIRRIFSYSGLVTFFIHDILHLPYQLHIDKLAGVTIAQIMTFYPIIYLNVYASMAQIDPSMEEQAENLGAKGFKLFRTVTLPLSIPGLAAGAAVVFIFALEDLGAPIAFRETNLMSYRIFEGIRAAVTGEIPPYVSSLALILLVLALAAFLAIKKYVSLRQYAMISRGGRWQPRLKRPGPIGLALIYLVILPIMLFTALPQIGVFMYALHERWTGPFPEGFTLRFFSEMVNDPTLFNAIINSLKYSILSLGIIALIGISTAYIVSRARIPGIGFLDALATSPIAIPGLAIAAGYFMFFTKVFTGTILDPFTSGPWLLFILAYSIRRSPFTTRAVFAGLQQIHVALEEAAMNLGASRFKTLRSIVLPLIGLNVLSGTLVSFVYCMAETSVSVSLGGIEPSQQPITYAMYDYLTRGLVYGPQLVAVMGVFLITIQLISIVIINVVLKQRYAYIGV